jgi:hypothetical protein
MSLEGKKVAVLMEADYYEPCRRRLDGAGQVAEVPALPALERR